MPLSQDDWVEAKIQSGSQNTVDEALQNTSSPTAPSSLLLLLSMSSPHFPPGPSFRLAKLFSPSLTALSEPAQRLHFREAFPGIFTQENASPSSKLPWLVGLCM